MNKKLIDLNKNNKWRKQIKARLIDYLKLESFDLNLTFFNGADALINFFALTVLKDKNVTYTDLNYNYATNQIINFSKSATKLKTSWNCDLGVRKIENKIDKNTDLIYITNPDNKLGTIFKKKYLLKIIRKNSDLLFIVDESYIDYRKNESLIDSNIPKNLIIIRTFSKFLNLENFRIAYFISSKNNSYNLEYKVPQYPISFSSIEKAFLQLNNCDAKEKIKKNNQIRKRIADSAKKLNLKFINSHTDFLSIKTGKIDSTLKDIPKTKKRVVNKNKYFRVKLNQYNKIIFKILSDNYSF